MCEEMTLDELLTLMESTQRLCDEVRIVDPFQARVMALENGQLVARRKEACFAAWTRDERCMNCISLNACSERRRMTKLEFLNDDVFTVLAVPIDLTMADGVMHVAMEIINKVSNSVFLDAHGEGNEVEAVHRIHRKLYEDSLTGAYNRRYFDEARYISDMRGSIARRFGFLLMDVKRFKRVNDTFGHVAGDELLREIVRTVKGCVRATDIVMRVGGDELVVVLLDCNEEFMKRKAAILKEAVGSILLESLNGDRPEINIGCAYTDDFDGSQEQIRVMYQQADKHMYEDKRG